jgi:hypothetical protein
MGCGDVVLCGKRHLVISCVSPAIRGPRLVEILCQCVNLQTVYCISTNLWGLSHVSGSRLLSYGRIVCLVPTFTFKGGSFTTLRRPAPMHVCIISAAPQRWTFSSVHPIQTFNYSDNPLRSLCNSLRSLLYRQLPCVQITLRLYRTRYLPRIHYSKHCIIAYGSSGSRSQ